MADLESALANVPGLAGYLGQEQITQRRNTATLANANQAATLQDHMGKVQRERGLREALGGMGPNATEDDVMRAVAPFVGADTAFKSIEAKKAREAQIGNTREMALARLAQQASQFDRKNMNEQQRMKFDQWYKGQAAQIAQGRAAYELPPDLYQRPAGGPPAAPQQGMPAYADALAKAKGNPNFRSVEVDPASPQPIQGTAEVPVATPTPAPAAQAPVAPPEQPVVASPPPPDAVNLDARDLAARAPVPGAPVARGEVPTPPGAPVARGLPTPPPELEASWAKLGRRDADKKRADWLAATIKGTGAAVPGDFTKTGEEYLSSLPESDRALVKKIANYDVDPKTLETRGGQRSRMLSMVSKFDPNYDQTQYANKNRAIAQFGSGKLGDIVRSQNTAIEHMDTLQRAADAMKNGNFTPGNQAYNEIAKLFGSTPPNTFEAMRDIVANEVVKGTIGTAGALDDRKEAAAKIKAASSPAQFKELINGWTELMGGQVKALARQYEGATKLKDFQERYLTERARDAIATAERKAGGQRAAPAPALEMLRSNPTVPMKEAFKKKYGYLPDGI